MYEQSGQSDMFRDTSVLDKAALLRLVRERIELLQAVARSQRLGSEAQLASSGENLRRLLADQHIAEGRVVRFDAENPEVADLFVFRP